MVDILQLVLGRSGTGKTAYLGELLKGFIEEGENKIIYLVPEQSSFEAERRLLDFLGERKFKLINVITFERMKDFIFRKVGGAFSNKLKEGGRNIFMSLAIEKADPYLKLYKKSADDIEMVQMMINMLKEMKSCAISCNNLAEYSKSLKEGTLKQKIFEVIKIINNYEEMINKSFYDPLDNLTLILDMLKNTKILEGYTLFVDSFNDFSFQKLNLLEEMLVQCKNSFFAFCSEENFNFKTGLFAPVKRTIAKIITIAKKNAIKVKEPIILNQPKRFKNNNLKILEKNFFKIPKEAFEYEPQNIFLYNAADIYDECDFIAKTIRKMVIKKEYRYRDFALVARNIEEYTEKIENAFLKYEVPYFMDKPQKLEDKPIFCVVFSAFDIILSNFNSGSVFRYLKTGLVGVRIEEISLIENYAFVWEINGDRWKEPFNMSPEGYSKEKMRTDSIKKLEEIEKIRKRIVTPLLKFKEKIKKTTGDEISKALYEFLEEIEIRKNIRSFCQKLIAENDLISAEEESRLWDMLMEALDQTASALKGILVKPKRYMQLLKLVVESEDISFIPQGLDEVLISPIDQREILERKVVFAIGVTEGAFPANPTDGGILNDKERKELVSLGANMYDDFERMYETERYISYQALSSASEYLFVSWPSSGLRGGVKFASEIIREIKSIFPKIKILTKNSFKAEDWLWAPRAAFEVCAKNLKKSDKIFASLKNYFLNLEEYKYKIEALNRAIQKKEMRILDLKLAQDLFGKDVKVSASQIEKFYSCRFQYFCQYGLKAKEIKKAKFNAIEYGSLVHFILEKVLKAYSKKDFLNLNQEDLSNTINNFLKEYIESYFGGAEDKSARFNHILNRCRRAIKILVNRLIEEFKQSLFYPCDYELVISENGGIAPLVLNLPGGGKVIIEGKVDRVDVMENSNENEGNYIRVIDYKTGKKNFALSDVIYGLNMQMLLYILAIKNDKDGGKTGKYKNAIPAGVLYMPAIMPLISAENGDPELKLEEKILREFKMNGLILSDTRVVQGMEKDAKGVFIPALIKKGVLDGKESLVNLEQIEIISKYIESMVIKMAESLHKGEIDINPIQNIGRGKNGGKTRKACDWCPYGNVCRFEEEECKRNIIDMKKDEAIEKMERKIEKEIK